MKINDQSLIQVDSKNIHTGIYKLLNGSFLGNESKAGANDFRELGCHLPTFQSLIMERLMPL